MKKNDLDAMFSSERDDWETPDDLFNMLHSEFKFTVDAAAHEKNAKLARFFTVLENGLEMPWKGETVWCNPPYGKGMNDWAIKFANEGIMSACNIVALLPCRTETEWFQHAIGYATSLTLIAGRLKFSNSKSTAPFPSCIMTFGFDPSNETCLAGLGTMIRL